MKRKAEYSSQIFLLQRLMLKSGVKIEMIIRIVRGLTKVNRLISH